MSSKKAAVWARVSSMGQGELSPDGQVERVKTKLQEMGFFVPSDCVFKVVWTSLDLDSCSEFQELKRLIESRKIDAVGFLDRDRIEAVGIQRLLFLSDCRENNVEPIVCQGTPFISEPEGQLIEMALALGKERSVRRAQSGAKQGLADRVKLKGLPPTMKSPYGYVWKDSRLVPNNNYSNAQLIWEMALKGLKTKRIGKELYKMGIPSSRGKPMWQPSSIIAILKNPAYAGRVAVLRYEKVEPKQRRKDTYGKTSARMKPRSDWQYLDGLVDEPIITWDQYLAVQERLELNKKYASRNAKRNYLLRGLIECQLCHRHYYGVQRTDQKPAYVCSNAWAQVYGKKCQAKIIPCSTIENEVKIKVRNFLENPEVYMVEAENRMHATNKTEADIEQAIRELIKQHEDTIFQEQRAFRMLSDEAFMREQKLLETRKVWLEEEIKKQKLKLENFKQFSINCESIEIMRKRLQENLDEAGDEDWRMILEALSVKVYVFGDGNWDIEVNVPIFNPVKNNTPWYIFPY